MKKEKIKINKKNHFIGSWVIDDECIEEIINFFNHSFEDLESSKMLTGKAEKNNRDSMELTLNAKIIKEKKLEFFISYFNILKECFEDYKLEWNLLGDMWKQIQIGSFKVEKFPISGHQNDFFHDRNSLITSHKTLSWFTFLNNVGNNEGELLFKYFDTAINPKKGLTLIFPSDWMHSYKQNIINKEEKFVMRGNFSFVIKD